MLLVLPRAKTYIPGPRRCIYCQPENAITENLTREHIIARKLGGELVLHNASCSNCARIINSQIETPMLTQTLINTRAHLSLPTSRPKDDLRIGTWLNNGMREDFRWETLPKKEHPFIIVMPHFRKPGILTGSEKIPFEIILEGVSVLAPTGSALPAPKDGRERAVVELFDPGVVCRFIGKIAHGAAIAELGVNAFDPFLPDLIMERNPYISYYIGNSSKRGRKRSQLHHITLNIEKGFLVADVQLFASLGARAYQAVVGLLRPEARIWFTNTLRISSTPRQNNS